jgi:hypothetical protein
MTKKDRDYLHQANAQTFLAGLLAKKEPLWREVAEAFGAAAGKHLRRIRDAKRAKAR